MLEREQTWQPDDHDIEKEFTDVRAIWATRESSDRKGTSVDGTPDFLEQAVSARIPRAVEIAIRRAARAQASSSLSMDWLLGLGPQLLLATCVFLLVALMWISF